MILVDCTMSEWSIWSTCEAGTRMRTRNVDSEAENGGLECEKLKEQEGCNEPKPSNDFNIFFGFFGLFQFLCYKFSNSITCKVVSTFSIFQMKWEYILVYKNTVCVKKPIYLHHIWNCGKLHILAFSLHILTFLTT